MTRKRSIRNPLDAAAARFDDAHPDYWDRMYAKLATMGLQGNLAAINTLLDRRYGRVPYNHKMGGDDGGPIEMIVTGVPRAGDDKPKRTTEWPGP